MKDKKLYTVKWRIPTVVYQDVYVYATSKTQAKVKAKAYMKDDVDTDILDSSGDYDYQQTCRNAIIESAICDEEVA